MPRYGKLIGSVALIAFVAVAFVWLHNSSASPKENLSHSEEDSSRDEGSSNLSVVWSPSQVTETLQPGQSHTISLSLTVPRHMATSSVCATPDIGGYLSITPATVGPLRKGQVAQVTLSIHVPIDATPTTTPGYLYLRPLDDDKSTRTQPNSPCGSHIETQSRNEDRHAIAKRLPVSIAVVWPLLVDSSGGFQINTPPEWTLKQYQDTYTLASTPITPNSEGDPGNEIHIYKLPLNGFSTIQAWLIDYFAGEVDFAKNPITYYTNPAGIQFAMMTGVPGLSSDNIHAFTIVNGSVVELSVNPASKYGALFTTILSTFSPKE